MSSNDEKKCPHIKSSNVICGSSDERGRKGDINHKECSSYKYEKSNMKIKIPSIADRFKYHKVDDVQTGMINKFRARFINLAQDIQEELPAGREQALILTKLEEAMFFTNAAIARKKS